MRKLIIAVCSTTGPGSGKTTLMNEVLAPAFPEAEKMRFSDPIKDFVLAVADRLGLDPDYQGLKTAEFIPGITGRDLMIATGDNLRKALDPALYAKILMKRVEASDAPVILIDDLRKTPEIAMLLDSEHEVVVVNVIHKNRESNNDCDFTSTKLKEKVLNSYRSRKRFTTATRFGPSTGREPFIFKAGRAEYNESTFLNKVKNFHTCESCGRPYERETRG